MTTKKDVLPAGDVFLSAQLAIILGHDTTTAICNYTSRRKMGKMLCGCLPVKSQQKVFTREEAENIFAYYNGHGYKRPQPKGKKHGQLHKVSNNETDFSNEPLFQNLTSNTPNTNNNDDVLLHALNGEFELIAGEY